MSETLNLAKEYQDEDPTTLTEGQLEEISKLYGISLSKVKVLVKEMSKARKSIDPTEIEPEQEEEGVTASALEFANPCHGPDGKFCETHGVTHSKNAVDMKHPLAMVSNKPVPKAIRSQVTAALGAIAGVHGIPADAMPVPFKASTAKGAHGSYQYEMDAERTPVRIAIKTEKAHTGATPPHLELTIVHEFGHYLDGRAGFTARPEATLNASMLTPELKNLFTVVAQTPSYQELIKAKEAGGKDRGRASHYASRSETFARVYAQWITTRSGNPKMKTQLDYIRNEHWNELSRSSQWQDAEFEPIAEAMDTVFRVRGILR